MMEYAEAGLYVALPAMKHDLPWVLACHGSGRCARSYRDVPFYARQREIALEAGCAFVACDLAGDTYGTDRGLELLNQCYERARSGFLLRSRACLWASSAGGSVMFRFAQTWPMRVAALLGTFPVWDLSSVTHLESMRKAWGGGEDLALLQRISTKNPAEHPEHLPDVPICIAQGLMDQAVPPDRNALALAKLLGDRVQLHLTQDVHSTAAFGLYDTPMFVDCLRKMAVN